MASNPMQKKARNSFLLGVVITLIICLAIGAAFYFLVIEKDKDKNKEGQEETYSYVYRLKTDVARAQEITVADVESVMVTTKAVPAGAFASKTKTTDEKGKETWINKAFVGGYKSKIDLSAGTILSMDMVYQGEDELTDDRRYVEYNMLVLPTTIAVGDYIDVRMTLPNGQDLIVLSKKEVKSLLGDTIGMEVTEGEILMMESAIVEAYIMTASKLYAIQYTEPGLQVAATKTYVPTYEVQALIEADKNITDIARKELVDRYIGGLREGYIDPEKAPYMEDELENLEEGLAERIEDAKKAREAYLSGLTSY